MVVIVLIIAAVDNRHVVTIDILGAYQNAPMTSPVAYMHFEPALTTMLCELVPTYRKFIRKDGRMVMKLGRTLYGCSLDLAKFGINISRILWVSLG